MSEVKKMKMHNSQRMVIGPTFFNRFVLIWVLVFVTILFLMLILFEAPLPVAIFFSAFGIFVGLLSIRGHIDNKTVIDLSTQTIVVNKRSVFLKRKQQVIPFSAVKSVVIDFGWPTLGGLENFNPINIQWMVSFDIGELVEIKYGKNREKILQLGREISKFTGKGLVDGYEEIVEVPNKTGFFGWLKDKNGNIPRAKIYIELRRLGKDAQIAERGKPEEKIINKESLGVIDIPDGPIRWVNVSKQTDSVGDGPTTVYYYTEYGVPDPRLEMKQQRRQIKPVRMKSFPIFGRTIDIRWKGDDFGFGITDRLSNDLVLRQFVTETFELEINAHSNLGGCWTISTNIPKILSKEMWDCFQNVANHLLAY